MRATVETVEEGNKTLYRVMLGKHEIGVSKTSFDAQFHVHAINDALDAAFQRGVEAQRILTQKDSLWRD